MAKDGIKFPSGTARGPVQQAAIKQLRSIISLVQALYGLTESDVPFASPIEERDYLSHLRRRTLGEWLEREIRVEDSLNTGKSTQSDLRVKVLEALLGHNVSKATLLCAKLSPTDDLRRIVTMCARSQSVSAQSGSIVNGSNEDDIVRILIGEAAPFVNRPCILKNPSPSLSPDAITWKQLLGVFAFYGCPADADAQTVISHFSSRVRERRGDSGVQTGEGCLPQYGTVTVDGTKRARDIVDKASIFEDSCLHILSAFAEGRCPSPLVLHPLASTYFNTDAFIPFMILVLIRSLKIDRSSGYIVREAEIIAEFSAQLEQCATSIASEKAIIDGANTGGSAEAEVYSQALWWALAALHLIEDTTARDTAIAAFVNRHLSFLDYVTARTHSADWNEKTSLLSIDFIRHTIQSFLNSGESATLCTQLVQSVRNANSGVANSGTITKTSSTKTSAMRSQLIQYRADIVEADVNRPSLQTHRVMAEAIKKFYNELK
eukprot:GDKJ01032691.1.p1 GENE.GDKJ01032691.1~~GDKJ01032691.1.p1  ORF type:complete len:547 (+),score=19.22 GDKJ01032691.1:171-1643(+)